MKQLGTLLLVDDDRHVLASMADWLREQGYRHRYRRQLGRGPRRRRSQSRTTSCWSTSAWATATASTCWPIAARTIPATAVIMITGYGTVETAVEAIRLGAFDFLTKPLIDEELLMAIERALNQQQGDRGEQDAQGPARSALRHGEHRRPRPPHVEDLRHDRRRGRHPGHRARSPAKAARASR